MIEIIYTPSCNMAHKHDGDGGSICRHRVGEVDPSEITIEEVEEMPVGLKFCNHCKYLIIGKQEYKLSRIRP